MVPVEVRAFALLSIAVMLLGGVLLLQTVARPASARGRLIMIVVLAVAVVLALIALVITRQ
ncbi:MAG TPA: hypothetical protein VML54_13490 [Candidatus Limnocylindrales bacterium]|nr:hypothetical protein [Candidatus Limnocylindrales bacterium]